MSAYDAAGKRNSSKTHARRAHLCELCGRTVFGNGGKVAHGRGHVRAGEAVEMVKDYADGPLRAFIPFADTAQIERLTERGWTADCTNGCRCDGAKYGPQEHPFLIHPACPVHGGDATTKRLGPAADLEHHAERYTPELLPDGDDGPRM